MAQLLRPATVLAFEIYFGMNTRIGTKRRSDMTSWQNLIEDIQSQLKPSAMGGNFHEKEMDARKAIADAAAAGDEIELRSAMGRIGGLHRRWARMLLVSLTDCALAGRDTSRHKTRAWQQRVFGQSVSSNALSIYGTQARSGGGRSDFKEPGADVDARVKEIYDRYKDALKKL